MLVLHTTSITEINFFKNNKLVKSKIKDHGKLFWIFTNNNCIHFDSNKSVAPMRVLLGKTLKESYAFELDFEEYNEQSNSETNIVFTSKCLNTNKSEYFVISQMKQPFGNLKRIANASGTMQGINEIIKHLSKGLRW